MFLCDCHLSQKTEGLGAHAQSRVCWLALSDPVKPAESKTLYNVMQFSGTNGFVKEYSLSLKTDICYDKVCKPIEVKIYWDMLGRFLRLERATDSPFTKNEHDLFTASDYTRLDEILKDRDSILVNYKPSFFAKRKKGVQVDAVSSATPVSVQNAVVKDAAHTSWALWHWVNGETAAELLDLTRLKCDAAFLEYCLRSQDRGTVKFAFKFILKNQPKSQRFHDAALGVLKQAGRANCQLALEYLKGSMTDKETLHQQLADLMGVNAGSQRLMSNYFLGEEYLSTAVLEQLAGKLASLPYNGFIAVFILLESGQSNTAKINSMVSEVLKSDDTFRVKYARDYLKKLK